MSTGPRIPVPAALAIARALARRWGMDVKLSDIWGSSIVGSLRRRGHDAAATVGDIEILSPMPGPEPDRPIATKEDQDAWRKAHEEADTVYAAIEASIHPPQPPPPPAQGEMFAEPVLPAPPPPPAIGAVVKGLKPCFLTCDLRIFPAQLGVTAESVDWGCGGCEGVVPEEVGVQIFRYWPGPWGNFGWAKLMRTGPTELGEWFLTKWKQIYGIEWGQQASAYGYLRDKYGAPVPTPHEDETLLKVKVGWIAPSLREQWIVARTRGAGS